MDLDDILDDELEEEFKEFDFGLSSPIASSKSTRISLNFIRQHQNGLNKHREKLLNRVPNQGEYVFLRLNSVTDEDIAYLSAYTGDEFALLRGKNEDVIFHGTPLHCHLEKNELLMDLLKAHKLRLECHTHPDIGTIIPSADDREFIKAIGQQKSRIISSYTGIIVEFQANIFNDI